MKLTARMTAFGICLIAMAGPAWAGTFDLKLTVDVPPGVEPTAKNVKLAPLPAGKKLAVILALSAAAPAGEDYWVEPMKKARAKFAGQRGTVAQFGDSITITMAFFVPIRDKAKNLPADLKPAQEWIGNYVQRRCWTAWKGADYGNEGRTTSAWGLSGMDRWLKKLNPEVALIMWGTNDSYLGPKPPAYTDNLRKIVQKCLDNGTVPILYTIPPVGNQTGNAERTEHIESFVEAARTVAKEKKIPLVDFYKEMLARQPKDFAKTLLGDNLHPSYPEAYRRDYSEKGLKNSGYTLRNYLTLKMYYQVHQKVLSKVKSARTTASEAAWKGPTVNGRPAVLIAKATKDPVIDGKADDACWKAVKPIDLRLLDGDTTKPTYPTAARLAATDKALFVAFRCAEPDMDKLVSTRRERDGNVWSDDSVEVFLRLGAEPKRDYYQLTVNPHGSVYDALGGEKDAWSPKELKAAVHKGKEFWSAEIAIPFSAMKLPSNRKRLGGAWRINLTRMRPARGDQFTEESALAPTEDSSSHVPAMFGYAFFEAFGGKLPRQKGK